VNTCFHCYVSGQVQGVFFRASTREAAKRLGLTGWVCNLPDGRVEVLACGEREALTALLSWLEQGPEHANVSRLDYDWCEPDEELDDFSVR
jgi:acylphosphatase